jgi:uncharacterized membrane protein
MTYLDIFALTLFVGLWIGFSYLTGGRRIITRPTLTQLMNEQRAQWLRNSLKRDLKIIDTQILSGLQRGTAFFASTSIFALGGCFALLGASEQAAQIYADLPLVSSISQGVFELKVGGLATIFGYAFFKFGWSYRLFNYCSIVFGTIPMTGDVKTDETRAEHTVERAIKFNILAGKHFNAGLRAIFLSIGYLGWFVGPVFLIVSTLFVIAVLTRRQFFSESRAALLL